MSFKNLSTKPRINRTARKANENKCKKGAAWRWQGAVGDSEGVGSRVGAELLLGSYIFCKPCVVKPAPF